MMKHNRLEILSILIIFSALILFVACDKKEKTSQTTSTQSVVDYGPKIDENVTEPVTISWWHFWTDPTMRPVIQSMVDEFEKQNPNITVELTDLTWSDGHEKIVIALAAGRGPDLLELGSDWIPEFVDAGRLADLSANLIDSKDQFVGWEPVTHNEHLYGRPWILGTRVMYYNTDLLARAGFKPEEIPFTFDQLRQFCFKVDSLGPDIHGWASNAAEKHRLYKKFLPFFWSHHASFFSENNVYCVISSTEGGAALKFYKELHDGCSMVDTQRRLEDAFLAGKVGAILTGDWLLKRIKTEKPDFPFTTSLFPGQSLLGRSFFGGEYLVVNQDSDKKGAALKLMRFITNPENQVKFCKANFTATPSSVEATADPFFESDPNFQTFIKQLKYSKAPPFEPQWVYIEDEFEKAIERCLFEDMGPFESLHIARGRIQEIARGGKYPQASK